jgi:hypothetical protein
MRVRRGRGSVNSGSHYPDGPKNVSGPGISHWRGSGPATKQDRSGARPDNWLTGWGDDPSDRALPFKYHVHRGVLSAE